MLSDLHTVEEWVERLLTTAARGFMLGVMSGCNSSKGEAQRTFLTFFFFFSFPPPLGERTNGNKKKKCTHQLVEPSIDTARRIRSLSPSVSRSRCKCGLLRYPLYRNRTALYSVSSTARSLPNSYCYRDCDAEVYSLWYPTKNSITHRQGKATQVKARPQLYPLLLSILWYTYDANSTHNCNEHRYLAQTGRRL